MSTAANRAITAHDTSSPLADPALRLAARTIDLGVALVPALAVVPVGIALGAPMLVRGGLVSSLVAMGALGALNLGWLQRYGQTVGKRVVGLRIVRSDGRRATLATILLRRVVAPGVLASVPVVGSLFALADALLVFSRDRRTLHDHLADTIVIDLRRGSPTDPSSVARVFA